MTAEGTVGAPTCFSLNYLRVQSKPEKQGKFTYLQLGIKTIHYNGHLMNLFECIVTNRV
jgi:hypothetical protein